MSEQRSQPGDCIGKYRILSHIATGGMGTVYKALDEALDRVIALKVLSPELTGNEVLVKRFRREALHAARLNHRNIVTLFESGEHQGLYYLAMEYVQGIDLGEYIRRRGQLDPEEVRRILIQACRALDHAFEQGITHRDIKPSNFLLTRQGDRWLVKLTDLGLARTVNEDEFRVTRAGTTVGTLDYMSPEQARDSASADIRSDIYSLGCTMYHMLAGQPPFAEGGLGERVYKHLAVDAPDVRRFNLSVPDPLWAVLRRMLAKAPESRYQTPAELLRALKTLHEGEASTAEMPAAAPEAGMAETVSHRPPLTQTVTDVPPPAPPPPAPGLRKRRTTMPDIHVVPPAPPPALATPEQQRAALKQFERARELLRDGGDRDYALQLLLGSCKLDPGSTLYRKTLRDFIRATGRRGGWWLGTLTNLSARNRLRAAKRSGEHRKVLEDGEELLTRVPDDLSTQVDMATSAEALGLVNVAAWMLELARQQEDSSTAVLKSLARVYEKLSRYNQAIGLWEEVRKIDPTDMEAPRKINDLAAAETIARGHYGA